MKRLLVILTAIFCSAAAAHAQTEAITLTRSYDVREMKFEDGLLVYGDKHLSSNDSYAIIERFLPSDVDLRDEWNDGYRKPLFDVMQSKANADPSIAIVEFSTRIVPSNLYYANGQIKRGHRTIGNHDVESLMYATGNGDYLMQRWRKGTALRTTGTVLLAIGTPMLIIAGAFIIDTALGLYYLDFPDIFAATSILFNLGLAAFVPGIVTFTVGSKIKRNAFEDMHRTLCPPVRPETRIDLGITPVGAGLKIRF